MPPRHDDATHTEKIIGLYTLLLMAHRDFSLIELTEQFKCSKATMLRLLDKVGKYHGAQLTQEKRLVDGHNQHFYSLHRVTTDRERSRMALSGDELHLLGLCRDLAAPFLPQNVRQCLNETLHRASVLVPPQEPMPQQRQSMVQPAMLGSIDYSPHEATLRTLLQAIAQKMVCIVTYQGQHRPVREHEMAVTRLVSGKQTLYAHGWKVTSKGKVEARHPLFLAVHRMSEVVLTRRTHHLTTPEEDAGFGIVDGEPFTVEVYLTDTVGVYVRERICGPDQTITDDRDGGVKLSFTARSKAEVLSFVLSFGRHARVLKPQWLADRVRQEAEAMLTSCAE